MKIRIKDNPNPLSIIFCLPGKTFSSEFLLCWSELLVWCMKNNILFQVSQQYDPVIYYCRSKILGGNVQRGTQQKPFDGKIKYDYLMWIDSDILFTPKDFEALLLNKKDIVSGAYKINMESIAAVKKWDEEYFSKNYTFEFMKTDEIDGKKDLVEVSYTGFGFLLVRYGVFESLKYPWFSPIMFEINGMKDFCSEDVSFCRLAAEKNFKIYLDPKVRVGHQKYTIL